MKTTNNKKNLLFPQNMKQKVVVLTQLIYICIK
jgi:hypothetical protein